MGNVSGPKENKEPTEIVKLVKDNPNGTFKLRCKKCGEHSEYQNSLIPQEFLRGSKDKVTMVCLNYRCNQENDHSSIAMYEALTQPFTEPPKSQSVKTGCQNQGLGTGISTAGYGTSDPSRNGSSPPGWGDQTAYYGHPYPTGPQGYRYQPAQTAFTNPPQAQSKLPHQETEYEKSIREQREAQRAGFERLKRESEEIERKSQAAKARELERKKQEAQEEKAWLAKHEKDLQAIIGRRENKVSEAEEEFVKECQQLMKEVYERLLHKQRIKKVNKT